METENSQPTQPKTCYICNNIINTEDYLQLPCKHINCSICLYNTFGDFSNENLCTFFQCKCQTVIFYSSIIDKISLESLSFYIENISSKTLQITNQHFICPANHKCTRIRECKTMNNCTVCGCEFCIKCGISHIGQTCYEYYINVYLPDFIKDKGECQVCKIVQNDFILICGCKYCNNCLKDYIINQMLDPNMSIIQCIQHKSDIVKADIYNAFGSKDIFLTIQKQIKSKQVPVFYCNICMEDHEIANSITLNCKHRFCHMSINEYFIGEIHNGRLLDDVKCPSCNIKVGIVIIKNTIPEDVYNKCIEISVKRYVPEDENEVMKWCISCNVGFVVDKHMEKYICDECGKEYCVKCDKQHGSEFCGLNESFTDIEKEILLGGGNEIHKQNYVKCPYCRNTIQRVSGCNFIRCTWPGCKGESFCVLCKKILKVFDI